jgi:HAE1 family hydrophobic/amphiphilic exporter-1
MLSGIVVNNAIVLVDYINKLREQGLEREDAILEAGPTRLRPILMTMLTTVLAMLPLAIGFGEGAELQAPMATVIVFGLSFSTFITLVLVPVMYIYTDNFTNWWKGMFTRNKSRHEIDVE